MITPEDMAFQLGVSGKTIRAFLRKVYARPVEMKNKPWILNAEQAIAIVRRFG